MNTSLRSWATPTVIAAFIVSAITGILMFFHIEAGLVKPVHEWLSWALVAGGVLHTAANWKAFKAWFSRKPALAIISAGALIAIATVTVPARGGHGNPFMRISGALAASSIETVAPVAHLTPDQAIDKLEKRGLTVANSGQSLREIAAANGKKETVVLEALFE